MHKLLLIDDEADVQYSFRRIFDSPEIELTTAASGLSLKRRQYSSGTAHGECGVLKGM